MKKFLLFVLLSGFGMAAFSQSPTTVTPGLNCIVSHNFNISHEGFSSPSIYSDNNDVEFRWDAATGTQIESSGLGARSASLISPVYQLGTSGRSTVGFRFEVPAGTQFRIRIISAITNSPLEILATTANGPVYTPLTTTSGTICLSIADDDLTAGRLIRFEFTFRAILPGNIVFDDVSIVVPTGGPLPVTFEGFVARQNADGSLKLLWNVSEELNVEGYAVESSTNGTNFKKVGYVTATGKSVYSLELPEKQVQTMYYRVKNIDVDGNSKYTTIIRVYNKEQTRLQIQVYPMPARDIATIQHSRTSANAVISVFSQQGKLMLQVHPVLNTLQTQLKINALASGFYFVRFDDGSGTVQSIKMLKN